MYRLYHYPLCPFSRKVRVHLAAKNIGFELVQENFWLRRREFIAMNPAATVPVLFDNSNAAIICGSSTIIEYIEEKHPESKSLLGKTPSERAETRRIQMWFDEKFYQEAGKHILNERHFNRYYNKKTSPNSEILRLARKNLNIHLSYIEYILENKKYLCSSQISLGDITAACQISCIDYFGDINWNHFSSAREWYSVIKSHKIFNPILLDVLPSIKPVEWYANLDF